MIKKSFTLTGLAGVAIITAACSADFAKAPINALKGGQQKTAAAKKPIHAEIVTKTKFKSGRKYGAASERVVRSALAPIPRGGGRSVVGKPYKINGRWYKPRHQPRYNKTGIASWYGPNFHGRKTANGEIYDQTALSAAHPTLPLPSYVRVTNPRNGRSVIVRVNDRGPFHKNRIIDLSYRTAELLGTRAGGLANVNVKYVGPAHVDGKDEQYLISSYKGAGSVEPSRIAARKKLLQYAGLSDQDIQLALENDGDFVPEANAPIQIAKAPIPTAAPSIKRAISRSDNNGPILVANKPTDIDRNRKASIAPVALKPTLLWTQNGNQPQIGGSGATVIKANPGASVERGAYISDERVSNAFDLLNLSGREEGQLHSSQNVILVGRYVDREHVQYLVDELSRFGAVSLLPVTENLEPKLEIQLSSPLPFAIKSVRRLAPDAITIK